MKRKLTSEELSEVLRLHDMYSRGIAGGVCADLIDVDLRYTDLSGVNYI